MKLGVSVLAFARPILALAEALRRQKNPIIIGAL